MILNLVMSTIKFYKNLDKPISQEKFHSAKNDCLTHIKTSEGLKLMLNTTKK